MRISDWSSDVCSSDLRAAFLAAEAAGRATAMARAAVPLLEELPPTPELAWFAPLAVRTLYRAGQFERAGGWLSVLRQDGQDNPESQAARSEEHTSELQSLLRISYAVFCLKKKKNKQ